MWLLKITHTYYSEHEDNVIEVQMKLLSPSCCRLRNAKIQLIGTQALKKISPGSDQGFDIICIIIKTKSGFEYIVNKKNSEVASSLPLWNQAAHHLKIYKMLEKEEIFRTVQLPGTNCCLLYIVTNAEKYKRSLLILVKYWSLFNWTYRKSETIVSLINAFKADNFSIEPSNVDMHLSLNLKLH